MANGFDRRALLKTLGVGATLAWPDAGVLARDAGLIRAISDYPLGSLTE